MATITLAVLAGCAAPPQQPSSQVAPESLTTCKPGASEDMLTGVWLSMRRQPGVSGELKTFIELRPDGTMNYAEQLTRPKRAPQGLAEKGCWYREGQTLVLRTLESNGSPVDPEDPIYMNRYEIKSEARERLQLTSPEGARLDAKRMPPDYRLSW